ncbi:MAG: hypothetical protein WA843_00715 [Candidatus Saccharimonadales bacterium]
MNVMVFETFVIELLARIIISEGAKQKAEIPAKALCHLDCQEPVSGMSVHMYWHADDKTIKISSHLVS